MSSLPSIGIILHDFALGGTERIALRLASAWAQKGHRVELFCGSESGPLRPLLDLAVNLTIASNPIARGPVSMRRLGRAAAEFFLAHPVDGIFIPGNYHWQAIPPLARIPEARRPAIVAQISSAMTKPGRGRLRQWLFERAARRKLALADTIVALAEERAEEGRAMLRRQVIAIPLPVLADDTEPPQPFPPGPPVIMSAGRFVPQKDFVTLVDAFALLDHPDAKLVIVGDGPQMELVRDRIARHGLGERVELPGYQADIRPWLDTARLFVLSSVHEGYAAVIVEALAAGRPVVATDCTPAATELLSLPGAGSVVPIANPAALAEAMGRMLEVAPPDPSVLASYVEQFRIGPIADRYAQLALSEQVN